MSLVEAIFRFLTAVVEALTTAMMIGLALLVGIATFLVLRGGKDE